MKEQFEKKENLNKENFITLLKEIKVNEDILNDVNDLPETINGHVFNANVVVFTIGDGFCNYDVNYININGDVLFKKRIFTKLDEMVDYVKNYISLNEK